MNLTVVAGLGTALLVAVLIWLVYRRRHAGGKLQRVLNDISADRIDGRPELRHVLIAAHGLSGIDAIAASRRAGIW